jgi:hypothetical protein
MDIREPIVVLSVFGRGNYLAASLSQAGIPVTLIDASHHLGEWYPEDIEGPFGFFNVSEAQLERLRSDEEIVSQKEGLVLWTDAGPIELRGPVTAYRLRKARIHEAALKLIEGSQLSKEELRIFNQLKFEEKWLAHLAKYLSQSVEEKPAEVLRFFDRQNIKSDFVLRNIMSDFHFRKPSPQGIAQGLSWCESLGVKVIRSVEIKDLVFEESRQLISIEVRTDRPGILQAEQLVVCLTAEEAEKISLKIKKYLFGDSPSQPDWVWLRYRFAFVENEQGANDSPSASVAIEDLKSVIKVLPDHFIFIKDEFLNWSHDNFFIAQRAFEKGRKLENQFDCWVKIPHGMRFNTHYLEGIGAGILRHLKERIPGVGVDLVEMPVEGRSTFEQLGPARHPVFSRAMLPVRRAEKGKNLHFDSPEYWNDLSWEGIFNHQDKILTKLKSWWRQREELRIKREAKLAQQTKRSSSDRETGAR